MQKYICKGQKRDIGMNCCDTLILLDCLYATFSSNLSLWHAAVTWWGIFTEQSGGLVANIIPRLLSSQKTIHQVCARNWWRILEDKRSFIFIEVHIYLRFTFIVFISWSILKYFKYFVCVMTDHST